MKRMPRPKPDSAKTAHVIEHVVDVDGLLRQRALVAEHFHAVDEIADAVGLRADQLRQRAVGVVDVLLEQLRGAADAGQRVLDLVGEHRGEPRYRARRRAMRELALDHLGHIALLQHQHDKARLVRQRTAVNVDQLRALRLRAGDFDAVLVDGRTRTCEPGRRAPEADSRKPTTSSSSDALEKRDAARQERSRPPSSRRRCGFLRPAR